MYGRLEKLRCPSGIFTISHEINVLADNRTNIISLRPKRDGLPAT